jgi:hypothetical protein
VSVTVSGGVALRDRRRTHARSDGGRHAVVGRQRPAHGPRLGSVVGACAAVPICLAFPQTLCPSVLEHFRRSRVRHVSCEQVVAKLASEAAASPYIVVVDSSRSTLAEVTAAVSAGLGPGPVEAMSAAQLLALTPRELATFSASMSFDADAGSLAELGIEWVAQVCTALLQLWGGGLMIDERQGWASNLQRSVRGCMVTAVAVLTAVCCVCAGGFGTVVPHGVVAVRRRAQSEARAGGAAGSAW